MSDNKKYYYMRLKENFFESEALVLLESMPDGVLYSNILLKMYLKSLKNEGRLMFNEIIPYNPQMIATVTRHQVGTVEKALEIFGQLGLIDILTNGAIYMNDIELFIGKTSTEGDRKKEARLKIEKEKLQISGQTADKCPTNVHQSLELEKEIEKEINNNSASAYSNEFEQFWSIYPRKVDKKKAYKSFKTAIKNHSLETILSGTEKYAAQSKNKDKQFIKHPATFLNNDSFIDGYEEGGNQVEENQHRRYADSEEYNDLPF
ncbi:phage replisome organizer N-terminal domain-containing protein [Bacillus testis]|uniref:phage replisome organizer N-terminal domain-containing protein n=1 Tax=Bacillus testis TaxID=1622072 RepID=UPI00067E81D1|nr:phage replisome organizer N-terminal domain-containing protein [Bacillus testis]